MPVEGERLKAVWPRELPEPVFLEETDSTNRVAKELARDGAPHGTAVIAARQTAGRGRRGRSFFSPEGGIYLSVILRLPLMPGQRGLITPMAAVAVCESIETLCGVTCGVKWVNDVLLGGKKLCGILAEGAGEAVILGAGINYRRPEEGFPPELRDIACALYPPEGGRVSEERLTAGIVSALVRESEKLPDPAFLERYRAKSVLLSEEITVYPTGGEPYAAKAVRIDGAGRLVVRKEDGSLAALDSGEVSVRKTEEEPT